MNIVPEKFSNNIIWNIGHIIAAHQGIVYKTLKPAPEHPGEFLRIVISQVQGQWGNVSANGLRKSKRC